MLIKRIINRTQIILNDYYIDLIVQKRLIGNRNFESINPNKITKWQSTSYDAIKKIFFIEPLVKLNDSDIIIDVGCGDAKLFNYFLYRGLTNKMVGYEINKNKCVDTVKGLKRFKNVLIIDQDIFDDFPKYANIFYLFNPFHNELIIKFIDEIKKIKSKELIIIYNNPIHINSFDTTIFSIQIIPLQQYKHGDGKVAIIKFLKPNFSI